MCSPITIRSRLARNPFLPRCLVAVALVGAFVVSPALSAQPRPAERSRLLHVTGRAEELLPATVARIQFSVQAMGKMPSAAQTELQRRLADVTRLLKQGGATRIDVSPFRLGRLSDGSKILSHSEDGEFVATADMEVLSPVDAVGILLDVATRHGTSRAPSLDFGPGDEALKEAKQAAWKAAVQDARANAGTVLAALGLKIEEVVSIRMEQDVDQWGSKAKNSRPFIRTKVEMQVRY